MVFWHSNSVIFLTLQMVIDKIFWAGIPTAEVHHGKMRILTDIFLSEFLQSVCPPPRIGSDICMHYAPVNVNHQVPSWAEPGYSDSWKFFLSKYPPSFAHFVSESPLPPTPGCGNLFILNVRPAPGSEHHCHNSLGGMSESCQNPLVACGGPWGFTLTGALVPLGMFLLYYEDTH